MIKKTFFTTLILIMCGICFSSEAKTNFTKNDLFESVTKSDKVALLMVHFGTSHNDTRTKTIEALNDLARKSYPKLEFREAWSSRMIIRIMGKRGEKIQTPLEALQQLKKEGYTHVVVQSSNVIEGIEVESLRLDVAAMRGEFKEIRVGTSLLYSPADYERVVEYLRSKQPKEKSLVLVGHGTYTPATAQYSMVDYVIRDKGYKGIHIGTIEGYPTYETMLKNLKQDSVKEVLLMPFMFVAGEHAKEDIAGEWRELLTKAGYNVTVLMEGLGEAREIQKIFMDHIEFAIENKMYDIIEKKKGYLNGETF